MDIKVMTFNIRCPVREDGDNYFPNREEPIRQVLKREAPDVIGFQEVTEYSRAYLKRTLTDYTVIGCGRGEGYSGESCSIAFKQDRFELIRFETKWLSFSPDTANSRYEGTDQSRCPRVYVHAELVEIGTGKRLHVYNTHLDHVGETARVLGMAQILQSISSCDAPVVLTGDMNANPGERAVQMPLELSNKLLRDVTASVPHTFHGFGKYAEGIKIDYIYTDVACSEAYAVEDPHENGVYYSDHHPVCALLRTEESAT